jgi:hypothetical protein
MTGERKLAAGVINQAIRDFNSVTDLTDRMPVKTERDKIKRALANTRIRIDAGRFLVERDDKKTRFWFHLAGVDLTGARSRMPRTWRPRLEALRAKESDLASTFARLDREAA